MEYLRDSNDVIFLSSDESEPIVSLFSRKDNGVIIRNMMKRNFRAMIFSLVCLKRFLFALLDKEEKF